MMSGSRGSGFDTRWLLANFPFFFNFVEKNSFTVKTISKCRGNGIDRLRKGNARRRRPYLCFLGFVFSRPQFCFDTLVVFFRPQSSFLYVSCFWSGFSSFLADFSSVLTPQLSFFYILVGFFRPELCFWDLSFVFQTLVVLLRSYLCFSGLSCVFFQTLVKG